MYPHMSNIIDTLFEGVFEIIPTKISQFWSWSWAIHQTHQKNYETPHWSCSMIELVEQS
jgi:hypothetical protein